MLRMLVAHLFLAGLVPYLSTALHAEPFNPDTDPSRISWLKIEKMLGPAADVRGQRFGIVIKTQTNEYWRLMAAGYRKRAAADGVKLDIQAAQSENDQYRQLAMMENMIGGRYRALLISPQSATNLQPAIDDAILANLPLVDVDGAVVDSVAHFVGPINRTMGESVANWFVAHYPAGGKVAIIEGQKGVFSTVERTKGFRKQLVAAKTFEIVASVSANWDKLQAYDVTLSILRQTPDLIGIYCNNDTMAFGAVDAVKSLNLTDKVHVFGSDGTQAAYSSIKAGELTGTVDIFPTITGEVGLDIAERLSVGQTIPRVVETPQAIVTRDNISRYMGDEKSRRKALLEDAGQ